MLARAVVVNDTEGAVTYVQVVRETTDEPDHGPVLAAISAARA
ncbi:MAG: hypothetical protein ACOX6M_09750 [Armatimonadota bacterium]